MSEFKTKYLGDFDVELKNSPYANYNQIDWAMTFIEHYGQIDGAHHRAWVIDQVARIHKGTAVIVKLAKWDDGQEEYRFWLDTPSEQYLQWVEEMLGQKDEDEDGEYEYDYDEGIAP